MTQRAAPIGILMLDSRFPRIPGDMGNAATWGCPVLYHVVPDATPQRVVREGGGPPNGFVSGAQSLVAQGARAITTTCGFLTLHQAALARAVPVPVVTSALFQVAWVNRLLPPDRRAGILTIAASALTRAHLDAAAVPADTPIGSTEGGQEFSRAILGNEPDLDLAKARQDNIDAALALQRSQPSLGAIVLECTNMTPYAPDIARATGLPVYSIVTLVNWLHAAVQPPVYESRPSGPLIRDQRG